MLSKERRRKTLKCAMGLNPFRRSNLLNFILLRFHQFFIDRKIFPKFDEKYFPNPGKSKNNAR